MIAVIITVMVLEIKVPREDGFAGLRALAPGLIIYLMSFAFTGTYWLNHQHVVRRTATAGHAMQMANLGFLFCLSLLPLSTAYVVEKSLTGFAVAVYSASLLVVACSFLWLRLTVHRHLKQASALAAEDRAGLRNHAASLIFYAVSTAAAGFFPRAVLAFIAALTILWAIPNLSLRQAKGHPV